MCVVGQLACATFESYYLPQENSLFLFNINFKLILYSIPTCAYFNPLEETKKKWKNSQYGWYVYSYI